MKYFMYIPGMPVDANIIENKSLGGSETAGIFLAKALAALDNKVVVFSNTDQHHMWKNVEIHPIGEVSQEYPLGKSFELRAMTEPHDVLIIQRVPNPFAKNFNSKINFHFMHDLARKRTQGLMKSTAWNSQGILAVSNWHKQQIRKTYDLPENFIHIIPNAIDLDLFSHKPDYETKQKNKKLIYMSRPERGLINLVKPDGIMEKLYKIDPDIVLGVCFYDNTTEQMTNHYQALFQRCKDLPNVELLGNLSKKTLAEILNEAALLVYPTVPIKEHEETSCIAVMEAQAAGTPIIACNNGAISETMGGENYSKRGSLIPYLENGDTDIDSFVKEIQYYLTDKIYLEKAKTCFNYAKKTYGWGRSALKLDQISRGTLRQESINASRLVNHFSHNSDYLSIQKLGKKKFDKLPTYIQYMKGVKQHQAKDFYVNALMPEHLKRIKIDHIFHGDAHYMRTFEIVSQELLKGVQSVIEIGCGAGHFLEGLAQKYPDSIFTGYDVNKETIEYARERTKGIPNLIFYRDEKPSANENEYDIAIVCEVLEHVPNPGAFIDDLERYVVPGGKMILTVPSGPLESITVWEGKRYDQHLAHFEHQDILDLWGHKTKFEHLFYTWGEQNQFNEIVGGQRLSWIVDGTKSKEIDYERKLVEQFPRELLSVCMIVKWDEPAIIKSINSFIKIADQIILGIDCNNTEQLNRIKQNILDTYPDKIDCFNIFILKNKPLKNGFDAARNETVGKSFCDWIMWIDADEELVYQERLVKYLKPNCFNGYAISHYHYSAEPAQVLKTDFPTRLFRRGTMKFYGMVHEHPAFSPEIVPNHIMLLGENISISHTGYINEAVRAKRFQRNWPLMQQDRKKYPNRILGDYLYARDLMHWVRILLQRQKNQINDEIINLCQETIAIFKNLIDKYEVRLVLETLPYATEAALLLTQNNLVKIELKLDIHYMTKIPSFTDSIIQGGFMDVETANDFLHMVIKDKMEFFNGKYV